MVYPRIAEYEQIAKRDDPLKIGNLSCKRRLRLGQKVQCLANDLKFSLNRRMDQRLFHVSTEVNGSDKGRYGVCRLTDIKQKTAWITRHRRVRASD